MAQEERVRIIQPGEVIVALFVRQNLILTPPLDGCL